MNRTATPNSVATRLRAEWTGFLDRTTPSAPDSTITAQTAKTAASIRKFPSLLTWLRVLDAEAELARPGHLALVGRVAVRRGRAHPGRRHRRDGVEVAPVLPGHALGQAVVVDEELVARVDRVLAVGEGELEQLRLGDRLGGAGLHAQVAVDAAQVVDLVDEAVALTGTDRRVRRVVLAPHVDATGRAHAGAQLAADALLHAVLVAVQHVPAVEPLGLVPLAALVLGVGPGDAIALADLAEGDREAVQEPHYAPTSRACARRDVDARKASVSSP